MKNSLFLIFLEFAIQGSHLAAAGADDAAPTEWTISLEELQKPTRCMDGLKMLLLAAQDNILSPHLEDLGHDFKTMAAKVWHKQNITKIYANASAAVQHTSIPVTYHASEPFKVLASGHIVYKSGPNIIAVYEPSKNTKLDIVCHSQNITNFIGLPNGNFATSSHDKTIKIWDAQTGNVKQVFHGHSKAITDINTMPNGDLVSASTDGTTRIWDHASGQTKHITKDTCAIGRVIPLSNDTIVTRCYNNDVNVWNVVTGELKIAAANVKSVEDLKNGNVLFTYTTLNRFFTFPIQGHTPVRQSIKAKIYDWRTGSVKHSFDEHDDFMHFQALPANNAFIAIKKDGTLQILDATTYTQKSAVVLDKDLQKYNIIQCQALDHDTILVEIEPTFRSGVQDAKIIVADLALKNVKYTLKCDKGQTASVKVLANGDIAQTRNKRTIDIIDAHTGSIKYTIQSDNLTAHSITSLPNGDLVAESTNKSLKVWKLEEMHKTLFKDPQAISLATLHAINSEITSKKRTSDCVQLSTKRLHS